jgi:hypothetical protein
MSISKEEILAGIGKEFELNRRVNRLFESLGIPQSNKVWLDVRANAYLFGEFVDENTSDEKLIKIIQKTPPENYDKYKGGMQLSKEAMINYDK